MNDSSIEDYIAEHQRRVSNYKKSGDSYALASNKAQLDIKLQNWPPEWENRLEFLIYGDFKEPTQTIEIPSLGIKIFPEKQVNTNVEPALCALKAQASVDDRSLQSITKAIDNINSLLGIWLVVLWGNNSSIDWWCSLLHEDRRCSYTDLKINRLYIASMMLSRYQDDDVRKKIISALYWIRAPKSNFFSLERDTLRQYAGYWNAFECLIDAINKLSLTPSKNAESKKNDLKEYIKKNNWSSKISNGELTPHDIQICHEEILGNKLKAKAKNALNVCFENDALRHFKSCFERKPNRDRLYQIRNDINHGNIKAEDPYELARINARAFELWGIILSMFGYLLRIPYPELPDEEQ